MTTAEIDSLCERILANIEEMREGVRRLRELIENPPEGEPPEWDPTWEKPWVLTTE